MRLASLLPMLLLAFSIPVAGQNCQIFDLTATVIQFNPNNCQFFVSLDFEHNGTSNLYTVTGNGTNYGVFPYSQIPLILGPFNANPNAPTVLEFDVQDAVFLDCHDVTEIVVPPCGNPGICNITDLLVLPGQCDPSGQTYSLTVNFEVSGAVNSDFFEVFAAGNISLGIFAVAALPIQIPAFPASGNPNDGIKVCIVNQPGCCEFLEFDAPDCANAPCGIFDLSVQTGGCSSDSTYKATIDFNVLGPAVSDSFTLFSNGQFLGIFGVNQLPLTREIKWDGGSKDEIKVCLTNIGIICCKTIEYTVPACLNPCGIKDLVVKSDTCTSDSTFLAILNFEVNDPAAVDSFDLWTNGEFYGRFGMNQLPLHIPNFHWNGLIFNQVRVCTGPAPACCKEYQFIAPKCLPFGPCEITSISLKTGTCTSDSTYKILLNFNGTNPGNGTFTVSIHNQLIDTFSLTDVPLMLEVPWNGQTGDFVTICILGNNNIPGTNGCCGIKQFEVPNCLLPCSIFDVSVEAGDCDPNSDSYKLELNFGVNNPDNGLFEVWGNGIYLGEFPLASLPIVIPNFPSNGNAMDVIKICIKNHPDCCETIEFQGPNCDAPCEIFDVTLDPGACNPPNNAFFLHLNFSVQNPGNALFEVWGNGTYLGLFPLSALPLLIPNFPSNGTAADIIKICINDHPDCCKTIEFQGPDCDASCEIFDLTVETGDCNLLDSTYSVTVDFQVQNPASNTFSLWANGQLFGTFNLTQLPLHIPDFPWDGTGPNDFIKVCITANSGVLSCCRTIEFPIPDCFDGGNCEIFDLTVTPDDCNPNDNSYPLTLDFEVNNPASALFEVWVNGVYFGAHAITSLPLLIPNAPSNGNASDGIKVCIKGQPDCCQSLEFPGPDCGVVSDCEIFDVVLDPGDCNPATNTFPLHLNFQVVNPDNDFFEVWGNGVYLGLFPLAGLPMIIPNFPANGGGFDVIKICINDNPDCCKSVDFQGPNCGGGLCDIFDLVADTGDCTSDSTYNLKINFQFSNAISNTFSVLANGQLIGNFNVNQLPLLIADFPWDGGNFDGVKVCFVPNVPGTVQCCAEIEFEVPDCLGNGGDCHIYDLTVIHTPCLCGQFFAILTFKHENGGDGGFDIVGNGNNYGNFPYDTTQPIILGPFPGDGTTMYEFAVVDHEQPDHCGDEFQLGKVQCMVPVVDPGQGSGMLTLSPNPTVDWLNVTALLENGSVIGQANVEVYATDGRLVQTSTVANGANFQLDVSGLPGGVYRLVLLADSGRLEGTFAKQ